jgi:predicted membrane chloride channel (bestrophin family)
MYMNLLTGIIVSVVAVTLSIVGLLLIRKMRASSSFNEHHDVTDPMLSVVGTLFAILLGFMVANSMQRFEEARVNVQEEANAIMDLYRLAEGLPKKDEDNLREHLVKYNESVVADEWTKKSVSKRTNITTSYGLIAPRSNPKRTRIITSIKKYLIASRPSAIADACVCTHCTMGFQNLYGVPSRQGVWRL